MNQLDGLRRQLNRAGVADVHIDKGSRAAYSSDASLYRVVPRAVVMPRSLDDVIATLTVAGATGVPITARGAGTSVAGNAVGPGIVLDFSRHLNRVLEIDPERRLAKVQPGVVQAQLQAAVAPYGLRFGPDPSTSTRCTIGGMIGNDACGSRSLGYGRTSDNVPGLELLTGTGQLLRTWTDGAEGFDSGRTRLRGLIDRNLAAIRTELGTFGRQISGYALQHALPENGFDLSRVLVGSEGTLGIVTEATVRLVRAPDHRVLVALGYENIVDAAADTPPVLQHGPTACEGLDSRIVDVLRERRGASAVPDLPQGKAWLFVELCGEDSVERARRLIKDVAAIDARIVTAPGEISVLWRIREDGAGLAGRAPSGEPAWAGWEDAAVPPARLASYLREFDELVDDFGFTSMPFGHFGEGCVHVRLDFPLAAEGGTHVFRDFLEQAAALVARHGGSLSGEHGDGRARSELLPHLYSARLIELFAAVKQIFDPDGLLNPGVLVQPDKIDASLRVPSAKAPRTQLALAYANDNGDFSRVVHRCTGVGKCRSVAQGAGVVMCPSYAATRNEKDSTRGRARLLQELVNSELVNGWADPALHDALDLCLSCKGCASDCPTGIDMASYKSEVLHQTYRRRLRPRTHYSLGWLPRWARLASHVPRLANRLTSLRGVRPLALWLAGVDRRRSIPRFAEQTLRAWFGKAEVRPGGKPVVVFVDSFTDHFTPEVGKDLIRVLEQAGFTPTITAPTVCCGLPWISTGQLDAAKRILGRSVGTLAAAARKGIPIVGIEPSCTAVLRHDAVELLDSEEARAVAASVKTLGELLTEHTDWTPPRLDGVRVVAQPHCHHHAVMGWDTDERLLVSSGASVQRLGGCCGLAGNFGAESGHYNVSVAVAEQQLLPAVADATYDAVLADGFSCRTQLADLTEQRGLHLAQLLAGHLGQNGRSGRRGEKSGHDPKDLRTNDC
ncbi:FAD-binding and (Fe-S)-binding domain-containing protein [Kribbella solani]|uniref:FAD/FMN-containing dehydrogenase/Fe-S oxidoreductase n=1 Tax=Kribbella solani TaxID=236067 RepID=A0A841DYR6_9ACTN|nr:FAD-binding and (Fe-S)-binding domain-containing protein [Kribbella solani]MBB5983713.1 FAD/FMN-containing dehydrogenase/Fe-S oxidoreductase [Kribbella solani]